MIHDRNDPTMQQMAEKVSHGSEYSEITHHYTSFYLSNQSIMTSIQCVPKKMQIPADIKFLGFLNDFDEKCGKFQIYYNLLA